MEGLIGPAIGLVSGAVGGNVAGGLMRGSSMGVLGNSLSGIAGGFGLSALLPMIGMSAADPTAGGALSIAGIVPSLISGLVGGGGLMAIIGAVRGRR